MQASGADEAILVSDLRNEDLIKDMCSVSAVFDLLTAECQRGWDDPNMEKVWNRRDQRLAGNGGPREKGKDTFDHVDSYYESYHEGLDWLKLESWNKKDQPIVLDFGAAPGGAVKFWVHDCQAKVIGITLPWTNNAGGMRMLYHHRDFKLILEDLAKVHWKDLKEDVLDALEDEIYSDAPLKFDVVHHGAIIHRGQRNELKANGDSYALSLDANVFKVGLELLRDGGHLLLVINPIYTHMCLLGILLPLFKDFAVHRTGFRSSSKFRILLLNKKSPAEFEAEFGRDNESVWDYKKVTDFLSRSNVLGRDMYSQDPHFSLSMALDTFKVLQPKLEDLWFDQLKYLMYLRYRAARAKTDDEWDDVSALIRGGEGWKVAAPDVKELFETLNIDDRGLATSDVAQRHREKEARERGRIEEEERVKKEAEAARVREAAQKAKEDDPEERRRKREEAFKARAERFGEPNEKRYGSGGGGGGRFDSYNHHSSSHHHHGGRYEDDRRGGRYDGPPAYRGGDDRRGGGGRQGEDRDWRRK